MPQVPLPDQLNARAPSPKPDLLPGVRFGVEAPLEAFGGGQSAQGVENAAQGLLGHVEKYALEQKNKADEMAVLDANYKTARLRNELMYGKDGAIQRRGLDAAGASDEFGGKFDQAADDIQNNLTSDQQAMYAKIRQSNKLDLQNDLDRHTSTERITYYEGVMKNGVAQAQDDAILKYNSPVTDEKGNTVPPGKGNPGWNEGYIGQKLSEQRAYILSHAQANGRMSPEEVKNQIALATSQTHQKIIASMLDNRQDLTAQRYFDAHKADITDGETLNKVTKSLAEGTLLGEAQRNADKIFGKDPNLATAYAAADKIEDPKVRQKTQEIIQRKADVLRSAAEVDRTKTYKPAYNHVVQGGSVDDIPQSQRDKLHPADEENLRNLEDKLKKAALEKTSAPLWYDLRSKMADPINGEAFAKNTNLLLLYGDKLTPQHMADLTHFQDAIMEKKDNGERDAIWSRSQQVESTLQSLHITDEPSQSYVRLNVDKDVRAETRRLGGKLPDGQWIQKQTDLRAREALKSGDAHQTFPKPPKEPPEDKYNNPVNNKTVSDEIGAAANSDKHLKTAAKAIDAAVGAAWETLHESGTTMSQDQLRQSVRMMSDKYVTKQNSLISGLGTDGILGTINDRLSKDTEKRGYEIQVSDVPQKDMQAITSALTKKGAPVNDRSIVYYYVKGLAAKKAANGGK